MRVRRVAGQSLVEFALVAPFMFVLLSLVFEFGWTYYQLNQLNTVARLAARQLAAQTVANNALATSIVQSFGGAVASASVTVAVSSPTISGNTVGPGATGVANTDRTPGNILTVYYSFQYWPFTRICDLRRYGGPDYLRAKYTFVIR